MLGTVKTQALATARMCAVNFAFKVFFAAVLHIVLVRVSDDEGVIADVVSLQDNGVDGEAEKMDSV